MIECGDCHEDVDLIAGERGMECPICGYCDQLYSKEKILISEIIIKDRIRKEMGDLISLEKSIHKFGLLHPIVISENNELIAGQRRIQACKNLEWSEIPVTIIELEDKQQGEIAENSERKDFTFTEVHSITKYVKDNTRDQGKPVKGAESAPLFEGKVRDNVAEITNLGHSKVEQINELVEAVEKDPKLQPLLDSCEKPNNPTSLKFALKKVRQNKEHKNPPKIPDGTFDVIYADPPWEYDVNIRGSPDDHYDVMEDSDIKKIKIPSSDNAVLFMWATWPKLKEALQVIEAWGFHYVTGAPWKKDIMGTGHIFRGITEPLLFAKKGKKPPRAPEEPPLGFFEYPRQKHSAKPKEFYDIIEKMYPNRKYLELFARNTREGWISHGNEL